MREYLDPVVKTDPFAQIVNDFGIAANNVADLIQNTREVFKWIRKAGLKLTVENSHFVKRQVEFLCRTVSREAVSTHAQKTQVYLTNSDSPNPKRQ